MSTYPPPLKNKNLAYHLPFIDFFGDNFLQFIWKPRFFILQQVWKFAYCKESILQFGNNFIEDLVNAVIILLFGIIVYIVFDDAVLDLC